MLYLEQVLYETLRIHPPLTSIKRVCKDTIAIEFEGKRVNVEEGINLLIPIMQIHHDPEIFMEPQKFHPERFDYTLKSCHDNCTLLAFGGGPRSCLGKTFALLQTKMAIVKIVQNFFITVNEKTFDTLVIDPNETTNTKVGGLWLNFQSIVKNEE